GVRAQVTQRVVCEREHGSVEMALSRSRGHTFKQGPVSEVHPVELADGERRAARKVLARDLGKRCVHPHSDLPSRRNQIMPSTGSTSGMKRYPRPKYDHTESCAKSSGCVRLSVPTTRTPTSSKMRAIQAIGRQRPSR